MKTCSKIKHIWSMYNNISNFFRNIADFVLNFGNIFINSPQILKNSLLKLKLFINDQFLRFENIVDTNIELGKYHLHNGDINDAIIRFHVARFFFDKENPEIHYWLGWCYFTKGKYEKALKHLASSGSEDMVGLDEFMKDPNSFSEVPMPIWDKLRDITLSEGNEKYYVKDIYNKNITLPLEYVESFLNAAEELLDKTKILDFGCGAGLAGSFLDYKIDIEYEITAMDQEEFCLEYVKDLRGERGFVYDKTIKARLSDVSKAFGGKKYDVIFSFDSLGFTKDLSKYFTSFNKNLNRDGLVSIMLPASKTTFWDSARKSYSYNLNEVMEQLKLAKFNIIDIKEWSLGKNKRYFCIISRK